VYKQTADKVVLDASQQAEIRMTEGAYMHTREVAVIYPILQSIITGVVIGAGVTATGLYFGRSRPWALGGWVAVLVVCVIWLLSLARWHKWVYKLEELTGLNLNGDPYVGPPPTVRVEIREEEGRKGTIARLPATEAQLYELARALVKGATFSIEDWTGQGRPFSKDEFMLLRTEMIDRNLVEWNNPRSHSRGMSLTKTGWAVMRYLAQTPPSPTPQEQS